MPSAFRLLVVALVTCASAVAAAREPSGLVDVQVSVPDATITIDGKVYGHSPMSPMKILKGTHTIKVTKPGHAEFLDVIKIEVGKTTTVEVDLIPLTAPIDVTSKPPGALVLVDGNVVGTTPFHGEVDPGTRTFRLQLDGYDPAERQVELVAGGDYKVAFDLIKTKHLPGAGGTEEHRPIYKKWWFWAAAGAVVIGTTVLLVSATGSDPFSGADRVITPMW